MGFMKPKAPSTPEIKKEPVIVTEVVDSAAEGDYSQKASNRKGLLSTILSSQKNGGSAMSASASHRGNTTLG